MLSWLGNLKRLVLPYNATDGRRIVLDGILGYVNLYGPDGTLVGRLSDTISVFNGAAPRAELYANAAYAVVELAPPSGALSPGSLAASTSSSRPQIALTSPGTVKIATVVVKGDVAADYSAVEVTSDRLGFYGTAAAAKPTVTGSRGGNDALASLLTALADLGLITDSSSA